MRLSVLITTFNRAAHLRLVLLGYLRQSEGDFEIIISDDGSTDETPQVVEDFRRGAPFPVTYIWRERAGHRRALAVNRAIAAAHHDWLLFTDCDALPHHDLVAVHRRHADPRRLVCGGRVRLDQAYSATVTPEAVRSGAFEAQLTPRIRSQLLFEQLRNRFYIAVRKRRRPHNYGLNMACSKQAMAAINGYDHNFRGWGNADGDVRDRLRAIGVIPKSAVNSAIVFHLWHPPDPTQAQRLNVAYARREAIPARCADGLDSLASEPFFVPPSATR